MNKASDYWPSVAASQKNAVISAAEFLARCVSLGRAMWVFGAAANVEAMAIATQSAKADGRASTRPSTTGERRNDDKTQRGKKPFGKESSVTQNPFAAFAKQKTYRRKKRLSALPPYPTSFVPGNGPMQGKKHEQVSDGDNGKTRDRGRDP